MSVEQHCCKASENENQALRAFLHITKEQILTVLSEGMHVINPAVCPLY